MANRSPATFAKRQREMEQKRRQAEKRRRREERKTNPTESTGDQIVQHRPFLDEE
jgi:hypothetical protein